MKTYGPDRACLGYKGGLLGSRFAGHFDNDQGEWLFFTIRLKKRFKCKLIEEGKEMFKRETIWFHRRFSYHHLFWFFHHSEFKALAHIKK
jgi:hypothetical protein